jgi:methyl-accepting chemotaxis protein
MSPFSAFGGVRDTPSAIQGATDAVSVMTKVINDFPERTRWQIELLLLEMESFGIISNVLHEIREFEKSFNSIAKTAETLPADVRSEFEKAMKSVEKTHPRIQASLTEMQKTVEQVSGTVEEIEKLTGPMNQLAENVNAAGKAWESTAVAVNEFVDKVGGSDEEDPPVPSTPAEENESGGIESITEMMEKTTAAAQELRSLVADLNQPMSQKSGIQQVTTNAEGLIERITWRAILVIFAFFTAMAVFLLIRSHFKVLPKSAVNKK